MKESRAASRPFERGLITVSIMLATIMQALDTCDGSTQQAAEMLGISRRKIQ